MADSQAPITISVAISRPIPNPTHRLSNYYHWALHVYNPTTFSHCQYEVEGEANFLRKNVLSTAPAPSRLLKEIPVGQILPSSQPLLEHAIDSVLIQNDIFSWDCQDYVIELLDSLEDARLLGSLDDYALIKRHITLMRGTMDDTQAQILCYSAWCGEAGEDDQDELEEQRNEHLELMPLNVRSEEYIVDSSDDDDEGS